MKKLFVAKVYFFNKTNKSVKELFVPNRCMFVPKDEHPCFPSIFSYFLAASDSASVPDFSTFGRQDSS
ncbi:MAG: hypothetical protein KIG75_03180, partial [Bacteroidales bacterium]|nr:hypothetical protein [Bacteroidales bacterium]